MQHPLLAGRQVPAVVGSLHADRPAATRLAHRGGGGSASVDSSWSIPVSSSRSTTIDRIWARITSAESSSVRLDPPGGLADRDQRLLRLGGHPVVRRARSAIRSAAVGQVLAEQGVRRRHRPPVVGRDRRLPDQHPGAAQGPVERVDQLDHPPHLALVPDPERRRRDHVHPLVGGRLELADEVVGGPGVGQQVERRLGLAAHHHVRGGPQQRRDLADHHRRLLARPAQRRGRHDRGRDQGDATTDQRVGPADQRVTRRRHQRGHDDRLHRRLGHQQLAAVEQERDRHRQGHDQRQLPRTHAELERPAGRPGRRRARPRSSPRGPAAAAGRRTCRG